jgi:hypothetical protein
MATKSGPVVRAGRRMTEDIHRALREIAMARSGSGLSCDAIGAACHVDGSTVARMIAGTVERPDLRVLAGIGASVGLELRIRTFPAGDPIRDAGQLRLLERFRLRLGPTLRWRTEVPLPIDGDKRAWDGLIQGAGWRVGVEAETALDDLQAVERRLALKLRDGGIEQVILLVADTRRNREALAAAPAAFASLSRDARGTLRALSRGTDPARSAIVVL